MNATIRRTFWVLGATAAGTSICWGAQSTSRLMMDDIVLSSDVQIFKGRAYVPVSDVARAMDTTVSRKGGTWTMARTDGDGPLRFVDGKISSTALSGRWSFRIASVQRSSVYSPLKGVDRAQLAPREAGDELVVVSCTLKNSARETREVYMDAGSSGNTSLTDSQSHGYVPMAYDRRSNDGAAIRMLPGAAYDFSLVFSVPIGSDLRYLVYSVQPSGGDKPTEFRMSLTN